MNRQYRSVRRFCVSVFLLAACGGQEAEKAADTASPAAMPTARPGSVVEDAAMDVVAFLQGTASLDSLALADSVTLYVSPEGGGGRTMYHRSELRDRASWTVVSGARSFAVAPPLGHTRVTTASGKHLNCREYDLASRYAELARFPHVGVRLDPDRTESCLQTWNSTFVFDTGARPRLIAVVYDQWEW